MLIGSKWNGQTEVDPMIQGEFRLSSYPAGRFRLHPRAGGLICKDGEVVIQVDWGKGDGWQDFIREQQAVVLRYVV